MSTLLLSLLLLFLIAIGLTMGKKVAEHFENPQGPEIQAIVVSPALKNMLTTSQVPVTSGEQTPLAREQDLQKACSASTPAYLITPDGTKHMLGPNGEEHWIPKPKPTPKPNPEPKPPAPTPMPPPSGCPVCPDMSQYIRLDEVPCWNCTLP